MMYELLFPVLAIICAFILDLIFGDPPFLPHPVRIIGWAALRLEKTSRSLVKNQKIAGIINALAIITVTGGLSYILLQVAKLNNVIYLSLTILFLYTSIALKDLIKHSKAIYRALAMHDLKEARYRTSLIVGRDTEKLTEEKISRAAIESVAENSVDGITAPLFYAVLFGPVGALLFKAVSTLDSMFGHKNEKYIDFGWASARLDDLLNYLPARLTVPFLAAAAGLLGYDMKNSLKIVWRDARNHPSPNSGFSEAAVAGALGIRLGGESSYFGKKSSKPFIGDPDRSIVKEDIAKTNKLVFLASFLFLLFMCTLRIGVLTFLINPRLIGNN